MPSVTTFSVIIPTYNRRQYLVACLESVSAQRCPADEVIVVDDGSTDGTAEILAGIEGITVIQQENAGPGAARNRGAAAARGDYLVFLDSDDLWFEWTLDVFSQLIEQHARPALLSSRFEDYSGELAEPTEVPAQGRAFAAFLETSAHPFIVGAGMMVIDRQAFVASGGFSEDRLNAEDHDLALRLGVERGFVQVLRPVTLGRRIHSSNETGNLERTISGVASLIEKERSGHYPGGITWQDARRTIIARHVRPVVLQAIRSSELRAAWHLYCRTLSWNVRDGRAGFLIGSPLLMLRAVSLRLIIRSYARIVGMPKRLVRRCKDAHDGGRWRF